MIDRIVVDPNVHFGKPCVAGTRITVQNVLELLNEGLSFNDIIQDYYPDLQVEDVRACLEYAAFVVPADLPVDLANGLSVMQVFSDEALWAAAQPSLSPAEQTHLSQFNHAARERSLTEAETSEQEHLLAAYNRSVLRRAQALAILRRRGYPIQ